MVVVCVCMFSIGENREFDCFHSLSETLYKITRKNPVSTLPNSNCRPTARLQISSFSSWLEVRSTVDVCTFEMYPQFLKLFRAYYLCFKIFSTNYELLFFTVIKFIEFFKICIRWKLFSDNFFRSISFRKNNICTNCVKHSFDEIRRICKR